jgi:hypothetical protein
MRLRIARYAASKIILSCISLNVAVLKDYQVNITGTGEVYTWVYPKVSGLTAWSENYEWYSSLPLGAAVSIFCESV